VKGIPLVGGGLTPHAVGMVEKAHRRRFSPGHPARWPTGSFPEATIGGGGRRQQSRWRGPPNREQLRPGPEFARTGKQELR